MRPNKKILLDINNLCVIIKEKSKNKNLLNRISFSINKNEIVGLIGESGSGKSLTSLSVLRLLEKNKFNVSGQIFFNGKNIQQESLESAPEPCLCDVFEWRI